MLDKMVRKIGYYLIWKLYPHAEDPKELVKKDKDVAEAEQEFLNRFVIRSKRSLCVGIFLFLVVLGVEIIMCGAAPNPVLGLLWEAYGALILAQGVLNDPSTIGNLSSGGFGGKGGAFSELPEQYAQDTVDGMWGIGFLFIGLLSQVVVMLFGPLLSVPC